MMQTKKKLRIYGLTTMISLLIFGGEVKAQEKTFSLNGQTYIVRVLQGAGEERVIEITTIARTEGGTWRTIHRQYSGACGGSSFTFLGEHETNDLGVVIYANPQGNPPGTGGPIDGKSGIGQVVSKGFATVCQ